jgi:transcriptional regulator with XRE-family HTH domain
MSQKSTSEIDQIIGTRMRARRIQIGMTQEKLADQLDLTFQQIQKYEKGTNRISVGRFLQICRVLNVESDYFFDRTSTGEATDSIDRLLTDKDTVHLVKAFHAVEDRRTRRGILEFIRILGEKANDLPPEA